MWFSDESNKMLIRYDGSHMEYYRHDPQNPNSPGGIFSHGLFGSPSGDVWIGYRDNGGLDRFDPYTNTFTNYRHDPEDPESLASDLVSSILVDKEGMVWLGTIMGLDRLDPATGKFTHFIPDPADPTSLSSNTVLRIYEDESGTLWIGTGLPFPWMPPYEGGLNRFHPERSSFTRYLPDEEDSTGLSGYKITAILEDSKGNFWIGTEGDGLHTLDRKTGRFTRHAFDPNHPEKLSRPALASKDYAFISFLLEDITGQIWIGTVDNGVNRYNPETGEIRDFKYDSDIRADVIENEDWHSFATDNSAWCAFAGQDGLIWISSEKDAKLYKIDLFRNEIDKIEKAGLRAFFEESPEILWIGTEDGIIRQDTRTGTEIIYRNQPGDSTSISSNSVTCITQDRSGQFWVGTFNGLNVLSPEDGTFKRYMHDPENPNSLSNPLVTSVLEDSQGDIWVGTEYGLNRLDRTTDEFLVFQGEPKDSTQIPGFWIGDIIEDAKGFLWIGGEVLTRFHPQTESLKIYPIKVGGLLIDDEGTLWAWNDSKLFRYDSVEDQFKDSGLTTFNNRVLSDNEGNLWISNINGILRYDPESGITAFFGEKYGVRGATATMGANPFRKEDGTLIFPMSQNYYQFNPKEFWQSRDTSIIYATELQISGLENDPGDRISLISYNGGKEYLNLAADENAFSIWFSSIDFRNSGENSIQYILEGYDTDWHQGSAEIPANYAQISPGTYTFRIKTVNSSSGIPSENSVKLKILPPWWATWWAYAAYGLLFVLGLWLLHRYQKDRVLRLEREKAQRLELEHAREIEEAYAELKQTQTQLIHSEKMASLGELTAGIAHEIKNPLNFVNNFSEVSRELIDEMKAEIAAKDFKEVEAIAEDLKQNLEKINHHGQRADSIVKGMLQHSRSGDGKKEPTNLNALADEYLRLAYHGLRAKDKSFNATLETNFDPSVKKVNVVPQDIGRVLLNLFTNAFHAVKERSQKEQEGYTPTVSVKTQKTKSGVEITVSDNGGGIPKNIKEKIFQPFFTTKPTGEGTGLGLSISYDIVTKGHGGHLNVESKEGMGTEFFITLPV